MSQVSEVLFLRSPRHSCVQTCVAYLLVGLLLERLAEKQIRVERS